jgi:hypothetical protein
VSGLHRDSTVVFLGPSLPLRDATSRLQAQYRPPAGFGDVAAAAYEGARRIVIVDGRFEDTGAVWHKEILFALSRGVEVSGVASMGALRAAELTGLGMRGVGKIYELFRRGVLTDDDEVAVRHEGAGSYRAVSEAMVNVRFTMSALAQSGAIPRVICLELVRLAKTMFYPDRDYESIVSAAIAGGVIRATERSHYMTLIERGRVDQKAADVRKALTLLNSGSNMLRHGPIVRSRLRRQFVRTWYWQALERPHG